MNIRAIAPNSTLAGVVKTVALPLGVLYKDGQVAEVTINNLLNNNHHSSKFTGTTVMKNAIFDNKLPLRVGQTKSFADTYMGTEYIVFTILERPFVSPLSTGNGLMQFTLDIRLGANTLYYPKFTNAFTANLGASNQRRMIREPTTIDTYNPIEKPPVRAPPKGVNPGFMQQGSDMIAEMMKAGEKTTKGIELKGGNTPNPAVAMAAAAGGSSALGWMSEATSILTEGAELGLSAAKMAAPFVEAAGAFAPVLMVLDEPDLINIQAELNRYERTLNETRQFGDKSILIGVEEVFKQAIAYYKSERQQGKTFTLPYTTSVQQSPQKGTQPQAENESMGNQSNFSGNQIQERST